jgi:dipeptidyl aminopeptidase/acylaminoacyl peptidase
LRAESREGIAPAEKTAAQEQQPQPEIKNLILPGEAFECAGRPAFILWPKPELRSEPQPWIFYAPTLAPYPDEAEKWMHQQFLDAGVAVAGIDVGEAYGSPEARKLFEEFYAELTGKRGLAKRPCLLGRSRGGLWVSSWAADHPERFAGLAGIYPVFDWRTYPGVEKAAPAYGLSPQALEQQAAELNPISRIDRLAKAKMPVFIIHGDQDTVVPLKENSAAFAEAYQRAGAESALKLVIAQGQGHNMWEGFFRCQELVEFAIARAKAGAAEERPSK